MSRDIQVRVVFCDWLAWLLRMKRPGHDVGLKSLLDKRETGRRSSMELDAASPSDAAHLASSTTNKVLTRSTISTGDETRPIEILQLHCNRVGH